MGRPAAARLGIVVLGALFQAQPATAGSRNVLVLGGGTAFRDAVTVALAPWELHVVAADAPPPSNEVPRAAVEARALIEHFGAVSVVWVGGHDREHALFVYDADTDQLVSRPLAQGPPFDEPTAASAALSVKTLLRSSTVAPPAERIGAEAAPKAATPADVPPGPAPNAPSLVDRDLAPPGDGRVEGRRLVIEVSGGARTIADDFDARIGLGASFWFGGERRFGVGVTGRAGPGLAVESASFRGRFDELSLSPSLRIRLPLGHGLGLEPNAGMTLRATRIDGVTLRAEAATRSRLDGSADLGCVFTFDLSRATNIGIELDGGWMLRYQRYFVGSDPVFELHPIQGTVGLRLAVGLW